MRVQDIIFDLRFAIWDFVIEILRCAQNDPAPNKGHLGRGRRNAPRDRGNPLQCRGLKIWIPAPAAMTIFNRSLRYGRDDVG